MGGIEVVAAAAIREDITISSGWESESRDVELRVSSRNRLMDDAIGGD
jgi:hypothetical protein